MGLQDEFLIVVYAAANSTLMAKTSEVAKQIVEDMASKFIGVTRGAERRVANTKLMHYLLFRIQCKHWQGEWTK